MPEYPPDYLQYLYEQISSIAAVLGGFSVATLMLLLDADSNRRIASWAAATSGLAAALLIGVTFLASILTADAMKLNALAFTDLTPSIQPLVGIVSLTFLMGFYTLLASLGMSGWIRSKRTGIACPLLWSAGTHMCRSPDVQHQTGTYVILPNDGHLQARPLAGLTNYIPTGLQIRVVPN